MKNSFLIEDFLGYMRTVRGASKKTIYEYRCDLQRFLKFMKLRCVLHETFDHQSVDDEESFDEIDISDLDASFLNQIKLQDLYAYLSYLDLQHRNQANTRARKTASIRSFFGFYYKQLGLINENIADKLETPKLGKKNPIYLTLDECYKLLDIVISSKINSFVKQRDFCIIVLFLNTGMRLSELSSINMDMIKNDALTVIGKGNKERTIYLNESCLEAIQDYKALRPKVEDNALFLSTRKKRMSNRAIQSRIDFYLQAAGFDIRIYSTHKLRHTAATLMYKYGSVDIRTLQQILGHASVSTTQIYTHLDDDTLRKAIRKNPLSKYKI